MNQILLGAILGVALLISACGPKPRQMPPTDLSVHRRPPIPIVRIGIAPEVGQAHIACDGRWRIGIMGRSGEIATVPAGAAWDFWAASGRLRGNDSGGTVREVGIDTLYAYPLDKAGSTLQLERRCYRGEFLIFAAGGNRLTVVNVVDLESYLRGVVPAEIGAADPDRFEAVKAQAVAARSYTLAYLNRWRNRGFDLLATVHDQVYEGVAGERDDVDRALRETSGVVAIYDKRPIEAYYSSTCGGTTAAADEVWERPGRDYLKARWDRRRKGDAFFCVVSPLYRWTETWKGAELERILKQTLPAATGRKNPASWGRLRDVKLKKKTKSRRAKDLEIVFEKEKFHVGHDPLRWILRRPGGGLLRSCLLLDVDTKKRSGRIREVRIRGAGYGHGVGLCQYGAIGMSKAGYDYKQILRFYYKGIRIVRSYDRWPG